MLAFFAPLSAMVRWIQPLTNAVLLAPVTSFRRPEHFLKICVVRNPPEECSGVYRIYFWGLFYRLLHAELTGVLGGVVVSPTVERQGDYFFHLFTESPSPQLQRFRTTLRAGARTVRTRARALRRGRCFE